MRFSEITSKAISEAFKNKARLDENLIQAQRRGLDRSFDGVQDITCSMEICREKIISGRYRVPSRLPDKEKKIQEKKVGKVFQIGGVKKLSGELEVVFDGMIYQKKKKLEKY